MVEAHNIAVQSASHGDAYATARARLTDFLIGDSLIESYHSFARHGKPYPFLAREALRPGAIAPSTEHPFQRATLLVLVDGSFPAPLKKHVRMRRANEVTRDNLTRLAPEIDVEGFDAADCNVSAPGFQSLLRKLLPLDYAFIAQSREAPASPPGDAGAWLTHMHVRIERLADNAIRQLAKDLGYIERRLFERGPAFVEALEAKFYEYYGFSANASGRKSAAAMVAQLLAASAARFTVFVSCQEDCRLSLIDESDTITHHLLIPLEAFRRVDASRKAGPGAPRAHPDAYTVAKDPDGRWVVVYRARYRRTAAAQPASGRDTVREITLPWLELADEAILPLPGAHASPLPFNWAESD